MALRRVQTRVREDESSGLDRLGAWLVPPQTGPDAADRTRRARLLLVVLTFCVANLLFTASVHAALGNAEFALAMLGVVPVALGIAIAMRGGRSIDALSHFTVASIFVVCLGVTLSTAARVAGGLFFLVLVPAVAILLVGRKTGLYWTAATFATLVGLGAVDPTGSLTPYLALDDSEARNANLRSAALVALAVSAVTYFFSAQYQRANDALQQLVRKYRQSEHRYRAMTEHAYDLIAELDHEGRFLFASPGFEEALGWSLDQLIGCVAIDRVHPDDLERAREYWSVMREKGVVRQDPMRLLQANGTYRWYETTMRAYNAPDSDLRVVTVARDVTERLEREKLLRHQQRLVAGGTMAAGVAHQLNNPLGAILAAADYADQFKWNPEFGELAGDSLDAIREEAERCGRILRSMLAFSREEESERWIEDVKPVVYRAVRAIQAHESDAHAKIVLNLTKHEAPVRMSPIEVEQVLINLLRNAVQAGATSIVVEMEVTPHERVHITVSDDGPGLGETPTLNIFDAFYTTRPGDGSGLGLTVAREIVTAHGGDLDLLRSDDEGAVFRIDLPLAAQTADATGDA